MDDYEILEETENINKTKTNILISNDDILVIEESDYGTKMIKNNRTEKNVLINNEDILVVDQTDYETEDIY